jgi:hypothetical protein
LLGGDDHIAEALRKGELGRPRENVGLAGAAEAPAVVSSLS